MSSNPTAKERCIVVSETLAFSANCRGVNCSSRLQLLGHFAAFSSRRASSDDRDVRHKFTVVFKLLEKDDQRLGSRRDVRVPRREKPRFRAARIDHWEERCERLRLTFFIALQTADEMSELGERLL